LLCLKAFAISSGVKPQLLIRNSVTTPLPGGVVDGADIWVQKLGNVICDLTVNASARGSIAFDNVNWLAISRFPVIIIIICAEGRRREEAITW
jgi:hypothetical protein